MILHLHRRVECNVDIVMLHWYEQRKGLVRQVTTFLANSESDRGCERAGECVIYSQSFRAVPSDFRKSNKSQMPIFS